MASFDYVFSQGLRTKDLPQKGFNIHGDLIDDIDEREREKMREEMAKAYASFQEANNREREVALADRRAQQVQMVKDLMSRLPDALPAGPPRVTVSKSRNPKPSGPEIPPPARRKIIVED